MNHKVFILYFIFFVEVSVASVVMEYDCASSLSKNRTYKVRSMTESDEKLVATIKNDDLTEVINALKMGADVNVIDTNRIMLDRPIHLAVRVGNTDMVEFLISKGANIHLKNKLGFQAIHEAVNTFPVNLDILRLLIESDADIKARTVQGSTPLHLSIPSKPSKYKEFNPEAITILLDAGADIEEVAGFKRLGQEHFKTPLSLAAFQGNMEAAETLIDRGAFINSRGSSNKTTALHWTAKANKKILPMITLLLENDIDAKLVDSNGNTPFHALAISSKSGAVTILNPNIVAILMDYGVDIDSVNKEGDTAISLAFNNKKYAVIRALSINGADITVSRDKDDWLELDNQSKELDDLNSVFVKADRIETTLLHLAVEKGNIEAARALLANKDLDIGVRDQSGKTALEIASENGNWIIYDLIENHNKEKYGPSVGETLFDSIMSNNFRKFKQILNSNNIVSADDFKYDDKEDTLLQMAVRYNRLNFVETLIEMGADVNTKNTSGDTPLRWAAYNQFIPIIKVLLENGADPNLDDRYGMAVVHWFASARYNTHSDSITNMLVNAGADLNKANNLGANALHYAAGHSVVGMVKTLLRFKVDKQKLTNKGESIMHWASARIGNTNRTLSILNLLDRDQINLPNLLGRTPLHLAVTSRNYKAVVWLIERGADIYFEDKEGETPMDYAIERYFESKGMYKEVSKEILIFLENKYARLSANLTK